MKAKDFLIKWLNEKYAGAKEIEDWTPNDVIEFTDEFAKHS